MGYSFCNNNPMKMWNKNGRKKEGLYILFGIWNVSSYQNPFCKYLKIIVTIPHSPNMILSLPEPSRDNTILVYSLYIYYIQ